MKKKLFLLLVCVSTICMSLSAQVTTSTLSGYIGGNKEPLIGAAISAVHEPSGTRYGVMTNTDGRYTIQGMRTGGPYTIEVTYVGYNKYIVKDVTLQLGETTVINVDLKESDMTSLNEVIVYGTSSKFAGEKKGATTNISNTQLTTLPTISRSINDFTRLSPYSGSGSSFGGRDGRMNNVTIDGANFNNNFGMGGNLPGGRAQPISLDAIEEIQVTIAPFDVRQANFTGAGINAITKSGTNKFRGSAYTYQRNENMTGNWVEGKQLSNLEKSSNELYGATFSGPIIKDKLFFFVNGEYEKSPNQITNWHTSSDGVKDKDRYISRTSTADMQTVQNYLAKTYNYDTGGFNNYSGKTENYKLLARLDWNINMDHKFSIRFNYVNGSNDQVLNASTAPNPRASSGRMSENSMAFKNSNYNFKDVVTSLSAELRSNFNSRMSNQLLATYTHISTKRGSNSSPFPMIDIWKDNDAYMTAGYELFTFNNAVENNTYTITDNFTAYLGNHTLTAGASFDYMTFSNAFMRYGTGYYRFASMDDFLNNKAPIAYAYTYGYGGETNPAAKLDFGQLSAYVQDEYAINPDLTVIGGLRIDLPMYMNSLEENKSITALTFVDGTRLNTGEWPSTKVLFSPRLGFNWDVNGDKSLVVRGGTGIFTGRLPFVFLTSMPTNSGMLQNTVELSARNSEDVAILEQMRFTPDNSQIMQQFPDRFPSQPGDKVPNQIAAIDKDFKLPQAWKNNLAIDYRMPTPFPFFMTFEAIYSKDMNQLVTKNVNQISYNDETMGHFAGPDNRYKFPSNRKVVKDVNEAILLTNTSKGYNYSFSLLANIEPVKNLRFMAAYTFTQSKDVSGNPGDQVISAWSNNPTVNGPNDWQLTNSPYRTPHKVVASVNYDINYNKHHSTNLGLYYAGYKGGSFSYGFNNDMNGDGVNNDLIYIPNTKDELNFVDNKNSSGTVLFTADEQREAFWNYVNQDKYLSKHKGEYAQPYAAYLPWYHRLDFKLVESYHFYIGERKHTVQLSFDIENVLNLVNSKWGVQKRTVLNMSSGSARMLQYKGVDAQNVPQYTMVTVQEDGKTVLPTKSFMTNRALASTWLMQVGVKYLF